MIRIAVQELINSIVSDTDRLLGHWCSRALSPGSNSIEATLKTLIETVSLQPLCFKIELNELLESKSVSGNLYLFQDPNFAINLDTLTVTELKQLTVATTFQQSYFSHIYDNMSTNTKIFTGMIHPLQLTDEQRLKLVESACYYSLYLCAHLNQTNFLQLKDVLHSIILRVLRTTDSPLFVSTLTTLAGKLRQPLRSRLEQIVHTYSPPNGRLHQSLKEHHPSSSPPQPLCDNETKNKDMYHHHQTQNYFLGDDWFGRVYGNYYSCSAP